MSSSTTHPTSGDLTDFASRRLAPARMRLIEEHLAVCPPCDRIVQTLRRSRQIASTPGPVAGSTEDAPPPLTRPQPLLDLDEVPEFLRDHPRYQVTRKLGAGGMGVVFQARHKVMDRDVAIKLMAAKYTEQQSAIDRFYREIKTVARLDHPNIGRAFDAEQAGDVLMLVMEYVDGRDLEKIVRKKGPLPIAHACHYIRQSCRGLQHAHEQGMVHRDLKPSNLMLTKTGIIKVLDFGLARFVSEHQQQLNGNLTVQDGPMGTPCYLSPEQALRPTAADIRSDVYSLGCTLYHLLAGRPPFMGETKFQVLTAHHAEPPPEITQFRSEVPRELWKILQRMLAKNPNDRPQTPDELADLMGPFSKSGSTGSPPKRRNRDEPIPVLQIVDDPEELLEAEIVTDEPTPMSRIPRATPMPPPPMPDAPRHRSSRTPINLDAEPGPNRRPPPAVAAQRSGLLSRLFAILIGLVFVAGVGAIAWYAGLIEPLIHPRVPVRVGAARAVHPSGSYSIGTFGVRFPGTEAVRTDHAPFSPAKGAATENISTVTIQGLTLSVGESRLDADLRFKVRTQQEEALIAAGIYSADSKREAVRSKVDDHPGVEWSGSIPGVKPQVYFRARLFVVEGQVYRLIVKTGERDQLRGQVANEFFDSFTVLAATKKKR